MVFFRLQILFYIFGALCCCQTVAAQQTLPEASAGSAEKVWNQAMDFEAAGEQQRAANIFLRVYTDFPQSPAAEDSLWKAIRYYYGRAMAGEKGHWETVEELFRRFASDFPESLRLERVYFDLGQMLYQRQRYRQALARFRLLAKKFPQSTLLSRSRYLQASCYLQVGQNDKAAEIYQEYTRSSDKEEKAKGLAGMGAIANRQGEHQKALTLLTKSFSLSRTFYQNNPEAEALRELGSAYLQLGNEEKGRNNIMHYLNIVGESSDRSSLLLLIAESYHRQGKDAAAQGVYEKITEEGAAHERATIIARSRIAEFIDDPATNLSKWQRRGDLKNKEQDYPYQRLMELDYNGEMAKDARRGLFRRYQARDDFQSAYDVAKSYLRQVKGEKVSVKERNAANAMLLYIAGHLLNTKKYDELYSFYKTYHAHVQQFPTGRFLYMVGQALEALYLYDQAAIVYYRALRLPLEPDEKTDLYYRRARVYLALKDVESADRLLTYLRKIYASGKEMGEIFYLSGRLAEMSGDKIRALEFYGKAQEIVTFPDKKTSYANPFLRLLSEAKDYEKMAVNLRRYAAEKWFTPDEQQQWYTVLGKGQLEKGNTEKANVSLKQAIGEGMPQDTPWAQKAYFYLGESLQQSSNIEESSTYLQKAAAGKDQTVAELARQRLQEQTLDTSMSRIDLP